MNSRRLIVFLLFTLFFLLASFLPASLESETKDRQKQALFQTIRTVMRSGAEGEALIDEVRNYVNQNSVHIAGKESLAIGGDTPQVIERLLATAQTGKDKPELTCGPRALAAQAILDGMGIPNRITMLFSSHYSSVQSHTFLEVFHEGKWQILDADYNSTYEVNGYRPDVWEVTQGKGNPPPPIPLFFGAVAYDYRLNGGYIAVHNISMKDKMFSDYGGVSFEQWARQTYGESVLLHGFD